MNLRRTTGRPGRPGVGSVVSGLLIPLVLLVTLVVTPAGATATAGATTSLASTNQVLQAGQYLSNGEYELLMQPDGNLVLYFVSQADALWASNTAGNPGAYAVMQSDGNFVVYSSGGRALWASGSNGADGDTLVLQLDGNLVIYSASGPAIWSTGTQGIRGYELPSGASLGPGQSLRAPDGQFTATMQGDGNFVVANAVGEYFQSGTAGNPGASITLQDDGNLVVTLPSGRVLWSAQTQGTRSDELVLQNDSNLVAYVTATTGAVPTWDTDSAVRARLAEAANAASVSLAQAEVFVRVAAWELTLHRTNVGIPRLFRIAIAHNSPIIHSTVASYLDWVYTVGHLLRASASAQVQASESAAAQSKAAAQQEAQQVIFAQFGAQANTSAAIVNQGNFNGLFTSEEWWW